MKVSDVIEQLQATGVLHGGVVTQELDLIVEGDRLSLGTQTYAAPSTDAGMNIGSAAEDLNIPVEGQGNEGDSN